MDAIASLKHAKEAIGPKHSAALALMKLRELEFRANSFDTELRSVMLAIQPDVKIEKENEIESVRPD
jgi:hypothetical protein